MMKEAANAEKKRNQPTVENFKPWCHAHARDHLVCGAEELRSRVRNYACKQRSEPRRDANYWQQYPANHAHCLTRPSSATAGESEQELQFQCRSHLKA